MKKIRSVRRFVSKQRVLAEIGDASDFPDGDQSGGWAGIGPFDVPERRKQRCTGRSRSTAASTCAESLLQIANVISTMDNNLSRFFHSIAKKKDPNEGGVSASSDAIDHRSTTSSWTKEHYEEPTVKPKKVQSVLKALQRLILFTVSKNMIAYRLEKHGRAKSSDQQDTTSKKKGAKRFVAEPRIVSTY